MLKSLSFGQFFKHSFRLSSFPALFFVKLLSPTTTLSNSLNPINFSSPTFSKHSLPTAILDTDGKPRKSH